MSKYRSEEGKLWNLYENQVVNKDRLLNEFLGKIKSPFGSTGMPAANQPAPAQAQGTTSPGQAGTSPVTIPGSETVPVETQQDKMNPAFNDGKITMGDLKQSIELMRSKISKDEMKLRAKSLGGDIFNLVTTLAPIPNVLDAVITGKDVVEGLLGIVKTVSDPMRNKSAGTNLQQNPLMSILQVDPELSKILDDQIEQDFLKQELNTLLKQADTNPNAPMPDMTQVFRDFLNKKYLTTKTNVTGK